MKQYVVELYVFKKWCFFSDHNNRTYAEDNAGTIHDSRNVDVRIKDTHDNNKIILNLVKKKLIKKEKA